MLAIVKKTNNTVRMLRLVKYLLGPGMKFGPVGNKFLFRRPIVAAVIKIACVSAHTKAGMCVERAAIAQLPCRLFVAVQWKALIVLQNSRSVNI
jgi:hypothetical protein